MCTCECVRMKMCAHENVCACMFKIGMPVVHLKFSWEYSLFIGSYS